MIHKGGNGVALVFICLLLLLFTACATNNKGGEGGNGNNGGVGSTGQGTTLAKVSTPVIIRPKSIRGTSGQGPLVVTSSAPLPGGKPNSGQVVLKDRILMLNNVSKQNSSNGQSILVTLNLTIKNTSNKAILNQSTFFQLMGTEGDTFTYQSNSSDGFYGSVPASGSNNGTMVFQIPRAAASNLRLLYRPEATAETVLLSLNM